MVRGMIRKASPSHTRSSASEFVGLEIQIEFQLQTFNLGPNLLDPFLVHRLPILRIRPNRDDGVFWLQNAFADA
jgi:hypothetical protein